MTRYSVLGCAVDVLEPDTFIARLPQLASSDHLVHIVTLNPEQIMAARRDTQVAKLLRQAELCTVDGAGLALALRLRGIRNARRITGVDLVAALAEQRIPLFLLGGAPGAAECAAERLAAQYSRPVIVGSWSGGRHTQQDDQQTIARIASSGAQAIVVAYGAPAQTAWIERNRSDLERVGVRVAVGVGGALDYYAGFARLAPRWVRRVGLEWLFRLVLEPWRLRRQVVLPGFACLAVAEAIRVRLGGS